MTISFNDNSTIWTIFAFLYPLFDALGVKDMGTFEETFGLELFDRKTTDAAFLFIWFFFNRDDHSSFLLHHVFKVMVNFSDTFGIMFIDENGNN